MFASEGGKASKDPKASKAGHARTIAQRMTSQTVSRGWLATAIVMAAALVLSAPFIGQLRTALRQAAGGSFATLVAAAIAVAVSLAVVYALTRIRERRRLRYGLLGAALAIGIGYALAARTGNLEVDAVERFHFLEYGLITFLFYRAWKPAADGSVLLIPALAGLIVGTCEEWLQWFIPARVGEARDVLLNLFAIACGLLFSLGLDPPAAITVVPHEGSRWRVAWTSAAALAVFAGFVHSVHLGYEIKDPDAGVFRSRYTADQLATLGADRAERWRTRPPLTWSRLSREDQYFSEGLTHVQRRNETWDEGNVMASRHENLILEKYYAPVLDTPSYVSATGHRWAPAQRADADARLGPGFMIYVSDAQDYPIVIWPKWLFWVVVAVLVGLILRSVRTRA